MSQFLKLVKKRYSCRDYQDKPVPEQDLATILEAARYAPTATNKQAFKVVVINTAKYHEQLQKIYNKSWFFEAPLVLAVFADSQSWTRKYDNKNIRDVDASIIMDHLILAAADLGLGSCWICNFDPTQVKDLIDLPDNYTALAFTPLGYPQDTPKEKIRKPLSELVIKLD